MVRLRIEGRPYGLQEILLKPGLNRLGRIADNDFQINDDSISSHHCQIELKDGVITVLDLNSTNGTFIDEQPIQQAALEIKLHSKRMSSMTNCTERLPLNESIAA